MMNDGYVATMSTLVLNLDDALASRLASVAARSHKALPDWAAEQLGRIAEVSTAEAAEPSSRERMRAALSDLSGIWKDRGTTEDLMKLTRGDD